MSDFHRQTPSPAHPLDAVYLPKPSRTKIAEHLGIETQLLLDAIFRSPNDTLPRAVLIDHLEGRTFHPFASYLRLALQHPNSREAVQILQERRHDFDALWIPNMHACQGNPALLYERGLPKKILCSGDLVHNGWYATITLPLERVIPSYGHEIDHSLLKSLTIEAEHAISNQEGTGLLPVEVLHHGLAPILECFSPSAHVDDIRRGVTTTVEFFRALRSRGLVRNECSASALGQAMRMCPPSLGPLEVRTLTDEMLFIVDSTTGRGATKYAIQDGLFPLLRALNVRPSTEHLRSFTTSLIAYVNDLVRIGVPIGAVMRRDLLPVLVALQGEPNPTYFSQMLSDTVRATAR